MASPSPALRHKCASVSTAQGMDCWAADQDVGACLGRGGVSALSTASTAEVGGPFDMHSPDSMSEQNSPASFASTSAGHRKDSGLLKSLKRIGNLFHKQPKPGKERSSSSNVAQLGGLGLHYNPHVTGFAPGSPVAGCSPTSSVASADGSEQHTSVPGCRASALPPAKIGSSASLTTTLGRSSTKNLHVSLSRFHGGAGDHGPSSPMGTFYSPGSPMPMRRYDSTVSDGPDGAAQWGGDHNSTVSSPPTSSKSLRSSTSMMKSVQSMGNLLAGAGALSVAMPSAPAPAAQPSPHDSAGSVHSVPPVGGAPYCHQHSSYTDEPATPPMGASPPSMSSPFSASLYKSHSVASPGLSSSAAMAGSMTAAAAKAGGACSLKVPSPLGQHSTSPTSPIHTVGSLPAGRLFHQHSSTDAEFLAAIEVSAAGNAVPNLRLPHIPSVKPLHAEPQQQPASAVASASGGVSSPSGAGRSRAATPCAEAEAPSSTRLLAMCPAVPSSMRRRRWCLEDYKIIKRLYKGSTSAVYKATCNRTQLPVALKVYFLSKVPSNVIHMINREIEIHANLVHKNIIMLYGAFQDEKHIVLVQEYAARGDLFGIHRQMGGRLPEVQVADQVLAPFLDALHYLHTRHLCHRDIKPENVLFTEDWTLKLADFGVSINLQDERAVTRTGTFDYMAPEVERCPLKNRPEDNKDDPTLAYGTAVDVWSAGVLAYELLVGFPPFVTPKAPPKDSDAAVAGGVADFMAQQATRRTLRFPASTSPQAKDFINAALAEFPGDRPTTLQLLRHPWLFKPAPRRRVSSVMRSPLDTTPELPDAQ